MKCLTSTVAAAAFVIFSLFSWINCDICDICMCSKTVCIAVENDTSIGQCAGQYENEYVVCDGSVDSFEETNFNLNMIPWPKRNTKAMLTATFNHFKATYLSK